MSNILSHPTRRFILDRLERLQETLQNLGQRLRASIAQIIGTQIGDAIQEAMESLLHAQPIDRYPERRQYAERRPDERGYGYEPHESGFWDDHEPEPEETFQPDPQPAPEIRASRWKSLLTGMVQLASWWWQRGPKRPSLKKLAIMGATIAITSLVAGPIAGGVVMTIGTTVLLTRMADTASNAVAQIASMQER
jgi:hypothetical protein